MSKRKFPSQLRRGGIDDKLNKTSSGTILPSHALQCFSVACLDMPHLEFGDKIVLPSKILLELQHLKISTPLLFMVRQELQSEGDLDACSRQYCSVQEFSAPDGQVFLPYWLMQNLGVPEGGSVVVTNVVNLPRGIYCRFQPESTSFLDLAAKIGPKMLMETALRRYSVLSTGSTIVIEYGNIQYYVRVAELKPASAVSLCGDVDLETNFMLPQGSHSIRPSTKCTIPSEYINEHCTLSEPSLVVESAISPNHDPTRMNGYGRRLRDGGYVESTGLTLSEKASRRKPLLSLQKAQQLVRGRHSRNVPIRAATDSSLLAVQLRSAQRAFSKPGYTLGTGSKTQFLPATVDMISDDNSVVDRAIQSDSSVSPRVDTCKLCLADVSSINVELHTVRCAKNPTYHKFQCSVCYEKILRIQEIQHRHCPDCSILCDSNEALQDHQRDEHVASCKCSLCHVFFTRADLQNHLDNRQCDHALMPCSLCGLAFKKKDIAQHSHMCSCRTERCDECNTYVNIKEFGAHQQQCIQPSPDTNLTTNDFSENPVECAYCLQDDFPDIAAVEYHVLHDCRIATSFNIIDRARTNQEDEAASSEDITEPHRDEILRPVLAQGRMRRKGDTKSLHSTPLRRPRCTPPRNISNNDKHHLSSTSQNRRTPPPSPTFLLPARHTNQTGKLRKPKPKPRLNPQLRSLPQQASKLVTAPEGSRVSISDKTVSSGLANLCISSVSGTSLRALAIPTRSQFTTRARRRPSANLLPPGRQGKLP